jgi:predicted AAA+ superfamily ATPase
LDDLYFTTNQLIEVAGDFYKHGGKHLFLDEVHKYPGWARHIKNLYDSYPDLQIVFTGSSIIDIAREQGDLSRRARIYELQGLSYREYLSFTNKFALAPFSLKDILASPSTWKSRFPASFRPLEHFPTYLEMGYYPFFTEDPGGLTTRLQQLIRMIVESDMAELHDFDIRNAKKMLQLLKDPDKGNLRETFFLNQLSAAHSIHYPQQGDFLVDNQWTFEVGGKNKSTRQIKNISDSFLVQDDVEYPVSSIPLWLFGFLY